MKKLDFKNLYLEFCAAQANKANWYAQYMEIYQYVLPNRVAFNVAYNYDNSARFENLQIYDANPVLWAYQRANDLHGLLMPKDRKWARLAVNKNKLKVQMDWSQEGYIDEANDIAFDAIENSNLASEVSNVLLDLVGGMGCIKVESPSDEEPLRYTAIPSYLVYPGINQSSEIERVWIKDQLTKWQALIRYPECKNCEEVKDALDNDLVNIYVGQVLMDNGNWCLYAFCMSDFENPFWYKEFYYQPLMIIRDRVHPGESEGRGIAMDLIWQIRDLNRLNQMEIRSMANKADPPIFYHPQSPWNPFSLRNGLAGMMIPAMPNGQAPIQSFQMPEAPPELGQKILDLRDQIKNGFMVDPMGPLDQPVHSATEMAIRENRAQRTESTDMGRLINDLPKKIFEDAIKILVHRGLIKFQIAELNKKGGLLFKFNSPLQDIQAAQDLQNFEQMMQIVQQYYGGGAPLAISNMDEVREMLLTKLRQNHNLIKSPQEIAAVMQAMAQQQQQNSSAPSPTTAAQQPPALPQQQQGTAA